MRWGQKPAETDTRAEVPNTVLAGRLAQVTMRSSRQQVEREGRRAVIMGFMDRVREEANSAIDATTNTSASVEKTGCLVLADFGSLGLTSETTPAARLLYH